MDDFSLEFLNICGAELHVTPTCAKCTRQVPVGVGRRRRGRGRARGHVARRDQRRPARRRHAGAAHHLHGDRADDAAGAGGEPAAGAPGHAGERAAGLRDDPGGLPEHTRSCRSARTASGSRCWQERVRQAMLDARRQVGVRPRRCRGHACRTSSTVIDKLKERGVEKVGLMTQPVAEPVEPCTKPSATSSSSARSEADGLSRMVLVSLVAHASLVAVLVVLPPSWRSDAGRSRDDADDDLASAARRAGCRRDDADRGRAGAGREPDREASDSAAARQAAGDDRAGADRQADREAAEADREAGRQVVARGSRRSGAEVKTGDARVDTGGAAIPFGGLPGHRAAAAPAGVQLDVANFCCPEYLHQMTRLIQQNWNPKQGASGQVAVKFTIRRDGTLTDVRKSKPAATRLPRPGVRSALSRSRTAAAAAARVHRAHADRAPRLSNFSADDPYAIAHRRHRRCRRRAAPSLALSAAGTGTAAAPAADRNRGRRSDGAPGLPPKYRRAGLHRAVERRRDRRRREDDRRRCCGTT